MQTVINGAEIKVLENLAFVYKMHAFTLFYLSHLLCELCIYAYSVNFINLPVVHCTSGKSFIVKVCLGKSY